MNADNRDTWEEGPRAAPGSVVSRVAGGGSVPLSRPPKASLWPLDRRLGCGRDRKGPRNLGAGGKLEEYSPSRYRWGN